MNTNYQQVELENEMMDYNDYSAEEIALHLSEGLVWDVEDGEWMYQGIDENVTSLHECDENGNCTCDWCKETYGEE